MLGFDPGGVVLNQPVVARSSTTGGAGVVNDANTDGLPQVEGKAGVGLGEGLARVVRAAGGGATLNHRLIDMTLPGSKTHATQRAAHTRLLRLA